MYKRTARRPVRTARAGFTLMEVLLVLVILVVLGSFVGMALMNTRGEALIKAAKNQVNGLETPLNLYSLQMNQYPTTAQGLDALRNVPSDLADSTKWKGPYLEKPLPWDPWDNPYQYACPGQNNPDSYDVWSFGPDGQDGTEDDIGNWSTAVATN